MIDILKLQSAFLAGLTKSRSRLEAENLALHQQLIVLSRRVGTTARLKGRDRLIFVFLYRICPSLLDSILIVKPETVLRWHRMGIRDRPTSPRSPWQNGYTERVIGTIRRECLDHVIVLSEAHLRRIMRKYVQYYNSARTYLSLEKDSPDGRAVQKTGAINSVEWLGGLHHQYVRM